MGRCMLKLCEEVGFEEDGCVIIGDRSDFRLESGRCTPDENATTAREATRACVQLLMTRD